LNKHILMLILLLPIMGNLQAATIGFNTLESSFYGGHYVSYIYEEQGFVLENSSSKDNYAFIAWGSGSGVYTGSASLFNYTHRGKTILSQQNISPFSILSIDLAPYAPYDLNLSTGDYIQSESVLFIGTKADSTTVQQVFNLGTSVNVMNTFTFNPEFSDLISVSWNQGSSFGTRHQFDNIIVQAVPIPGALILFITGILSFSRFIKKKS
jgi:hypothetical protein